MNEKTDKIMIVGYYIKPNRKKPNKGVIYNQKGISPCLTDYSGGQFSTYNHRETIYILPSPRCTYGEWRLSTRYAPTLKQRDYKDPLLIIKIIETMAKETNINLPEELKGKKFRIRKLTPRECFRLMGVDDADIDKIQATSISNSAQYKLAGNSIVVDVLYHIFRKMFIETEDENQQLSLF